MERTQGSMRQDKKPLQTTMHKTGAEVAATDDQPRHLPSGVLAIKALGFKARVGV